MDFGEVGIFLLFVFHIASYMNMIQGALAEEIQIILDNELVLGDRSLLKVDKVNWGNCLT